MLSNGWDLDNAPVHHSKMTLHFFEHSPLKTFPCSLYLRNISLFDFYLFEKVKNALIGQEIPDEIDILEIGTQILDGFSDEELQVVFRS
jgi:hypothetical protein